MTVVLYKRQRELLLFLYQYIQKYRHAPTLVEICEALSLTSPATVHEHLGNLEKRGFIRRYEGSVRGIELLEQTTLLLSPSEVELPLLGFIAAGAPLEPYPQEDATAAVGSSWISGKKPAFILQVKGNSMIEDGILEGDFVICEKQETAQDGDIVVALLDDGFATLKRFYREPDRIRLEPANAKMSPIYAKNVKIQGKVVGVYRRY